MLAETGSGSSPARASSSPPTASTSRSRTSPTTLRADFAPEDLPLVFWTADRVIDRTAGVAPDYWHRFLGLLLDGLRADAASPLPRPPLTPAQLDRTA